MQRTCEYYPALPSPFTAGSLGAVLLVGLSLSGYGSQQTSHVKQLEISGAAHVAYVSRESLSIVPQQDLEDLRLFSQFSLGISRGTRDIPDYFFEVLEEEFESLLA